MREQAENFEGLSFDAGNSIYELIANGNKKYLNYAAITDPYNNLILNYQVFHQEIDNFAAGLQSLGVKKGDVLALISENNGRWPVVDLAIMKCGAVNAVRGGNAPKEELWYVIQHSESRALICQTVDIYQKIKAKLGDFGLAFIIILFKDATLDLSDSPCPVFTYEEVCSRRYQFKPVEVRRNDLASIMYTSGTTGAPKGVLLEHGNLMYQIEHAHNCVLAQPGEASLHVLPVWHAYERIGIYYYLSQSCHLHFTNIPSLKEDLLKYHLDHMMSVPRIWEMVRESIYKKIEKQSKILSLIFRGAVRLSSAYKAHEMYCERRIVNEEHYQLKKTFKHKLFSLFYKPWHELFSLVLYKKIRKTANLNFKVILSGGGALSLQDELFYDIIGVNLRIGYGLTETAPVLTLRSIKDKNFLRSAGKPLIGTELKIIDPKTLKDLPPFTKGLVVVRGPQVMRGYLKDEKATKNAFLAEGWFNTGDLGWLTKDNNLILVGRIKETIVLSNGENVEPTPLEEVCVVSPYIEQIMLVGQDRNFIAALVVPSKLAIEKCGVSNEIWEDRKSDILEHPALNNLIKSEIAARQLQKYNLRPFERIKKFVLLKESFTIENGLLSQTLKVKRNKVYERYQEIIEKIYI